MNKKNSVFIATSLDGFIADREGGVEWLHSIPNPDHIDMGYNAFFASVDALIMGRNTFEFVCNSGMKWPYSKPVYVLSHTLSAIPEAYKSKATLVSGAIKDVLYKIHRNGHGKLYIDGGLTVQSFLREDLIDEMIITTIPVLLGGGIPLFGEMPKRLEFECVDSKIYLDCIVQNHFRRKR